VSGGKQQEDTMKNMARIVHKEGLDGWMWFNGEPGDGGQDYPTAQEMAEYSGWYWDLNSHSTPSTREWQGPFETKAEALSDAQSA
jgi:hypothetical protein